MKARYYANHQQSLTGGTTILLSLYTDYGDKTKEKYQQITIRLTSFGDDFPIGEIEIKNESAQSLLDSQKKTEEDLELIQKEIVDCNLKKTEKEKLHMSAKSRLNESISKLMEHHGKTMYELRCTVEAKENILKKLKILNETESSIFNKEYVQLSEENKE